jgi:hypothetical protein
MKKITSLANLVLLFGLLQLPANAVQLIVPAYFTPTPLNKLKKQTTNYRLSRSSIPIPELEMIMAKPISHKPTQIFIMLAARSSVMCHRDM